MVRARALSQWYDFERKVVEQAAYDAINYTLDQCGNNQFALYVGATAYGLVQIVMAVGNSLVDITNLGLGIQGAWNGEENIIVGIFEDGMRVMTLAGPFAQGVKMFSCLKIARVMVPATAEVPYCAFISAAQAMRNTAVAAFATIDDLCAALKMPLTATARMTVAEALKLVRRLGGVASMERSFSTLLQVEKAVKSSPLRVYLVELKWQAGDWGEQCHAIAVQWDKARNCAVWMDPSGAAGNTLKEIESIILSKNPGALHFKNFASAVPQAVGWVENAVWRNCWDATRVGLLVDPANWNNWSSYTANLGLEMRSVTIAKPERRVPQPSPGPSPRAARGIPHIA